MLADDKLFGSDKATPNRVTSTHFTSATTDIG
jgi:hypothetical protein